MIGSSQFSEGKIFWDVLVANTLSGNVSIGVGTGSMNLSSYVGNDTYGFAYYGNNGKVENGGSDKAYGTKLVTGDIIRVKIDMGSNQLFFEKNGESLGLAYTIPNPIYPALSLHSPGDKLTILDIGKW